MRPQPDSAGSSSEPGSPSEGIQQSRCIVRLSRQNAIRPLFDVDHPEGPRDTPEISFRDLDRSSMRPAVRLARRPDGGFRLEGVAAAPIEGVPGTAGFVLTGAGPRGVSWNATERGWILNALAAGPECELGRTAALGLEPVLAPVSVLLADGRLFRLAMIGAADHRFELGRWDVPGAYLVARSVAGSWELERTAAGTALEAPPELWILTCIEIGRLDGWY